MRKRKWPILLYLNRSFSLPHTVDMIILTDPDVEIRMRRIPFFKNLDFQFHVSNSLVAGNNITACFQFVLYIFIRPIFYPSKSLHRSDRTTPQ